MYPAPKFPLLVEAIAEAMRNHSSRHLIPIDQYQTSFIRIFQRLHDSITSVWVQLDGANLVFTIACKSTDATFRVKDSLVYDLSPFYVSSMSGAHADDRRVTYVIHNVGFQMQSGTHWHTRLAFGCELLAR